VLRFCVLRGVTDVAHLPVSKATLDGSVVALTGTRERFPGYRSGYDQWKKAFDAGRAGVFTISLAEVVATIEAGILRPRAPAANGK
jgi:hypothetical protein